MRAKGGTRRRLDRTCLAFAIGVAVGVPAVMRVGKRGALAAAVVGSVAVVGYLPSTLASSPGEDPVTAQVDHSPQFSAVPFVSTEAVVSLMSNCTSCHDTSAESYAAKNFPDIPHQTEGWGECSFCHAPARLAPPPESHKDLPDAVCQACHKATTNSPPSLGHVLWQDKTCSSCHRTSLESLVSHDDRGELMCTLCHDTGTIKRPVIPDIAAEDR